MAKHKQLPARNKGLFSCFSCVSLDVDHAESSPDLRSRAKDLHLFPPNQLYFTAQEEPAASVSQRNPQGTDGALQSISDHALIPGDDSMHEQPEQTSKTSEKATLASERVTMMTSEEQLAQGLVQDIQPQSRTMADQHNLQDIPDTKNEGLLKLEHDCGQQNDTPCRESSVKRRVMRIESSLSSVKHYQPDGQNARAHDPATVASVKENTNDLPELGMNRMFDHLGKAMAALHQVSNSFEILSIDKVAPAVKSGQKMATSGESSRTAETFSIAKQASDGEECGTGNEQKARVQRGRGDVLSIEIPRSKSNLSELKVGAEVKEKEQESPHLLETHLKEQQTRAARASAERHQLHKLLADKDDLITALVQELDEKYLLLETREQQGTNDDLLTETPRLKGRTRLSEASSHLSSGPNSPHLLESYLKEQHSRAARASAEKGTLYRQLAAKDELITILEYELQEKFALLENDQNSTDGLTIDVQRRGSSMSKEWPGRGSTGSTGGSPHLLENHLNEQQSRAAQASAQNVILYRQLADKEDLIGKLEKDLEQKSLEITLMREELEQLHRLIDGRDEVWRQYLDTCAEDSFDAQNGEDAYSQGHES